MSSRTSPGTRPKVGIVTSVGRTLDAFFVPIVEELTRQGFDVVAASGETSRLDGWTQLRGFTQRPGARTPQAFASLRRWVTREKPDVLVTNTATASAVVRLAGTRVPVVYFCHGLHWSSPTGRNAVGWRALERALLRTTASVICLNRADEDWFLRHARVPVVRLPYGIGLPVAEFPRSPVPAGPLKLTWVGDFTPRKRPGLALEVADHLANELGLPVTLQMLGEGDLRPGIVERIEATGWSSRISAHGRGPVHPALEAATALLHTATWEGLPRVALEAAAVGRWTYGFDVKGVSDAPLVRTAPDGDVASLARSIADDYARGAIFDVPDLHERLDAREAGALIGQVVARTLKEQ